MPVIIEDSSGDTLHLAEEGSGAITMSFTDEDGAAVTPNEVKWSLTDNDGTVINSRDQVSETPDTSVTILLSGDDLAFQSGETGNNVKRHLVIEATYNSDLGSDIPLKEDGIFYVDNLAKIA